MHDHLQLKNRLVETFGREPESLNDIAHAMIAVINQQSNGRKNVSANFKVLGLKWNLKRGLLIVNRDHTWGGRYLEKDNIQSWSGDVWIRYDTTVKSSSSDPLKAALLYKTVDINSGSTPNQNNPWLKEVKAYRQVSKLHGNFISVKEPVCYGFKCLFFEEDFPNIANEISKQDMWNILNDIKTKEYTHEFSWSDPETRERDKLIVDAAKNIHCYV